MSPPPGNPNSLPSDLNPNAPPFSNNRSPPPHHHTAQLPLLLPPIKSTETHGGEISPPSPPLKPIFQHPAVIPNYNHQFFYHYYYYYIPSHRQPYNSFPPASPFYTVNNNYYHHFAGLGPPTVTILPQPPPPLLPPTSPVGRNRLVEIGSGGDDGAEERRERNIVKKKKKKKKKESATAARVIVRGGPSRPPPLCQYRKVKNMGSKKSPPGRIALRGAETSLIICNIPNQLRRDDLIRYLDRHCYAQNIYVVPSAAAAQQQLASYSDLVPSEYDFFYLPMDFRRGDNLGYAFVNFTTAVAASRFQAAFQNHQWREAVPDSRKVCEVAAAAIQGKEGLIKKFMGSRFWCRRDDYLPAHFSPPRDGFNASTPILVGERLLR